MSESKQALALHLVGGGEPILLAIADETARDLGTKLPAKLLAGEIETIEAANGSRFVVNFSQVAAAHIDTLPPMSQPYGALRRS